MFWSDYNRLYPGDSGASGSNSFGSQMDDDFEYVDSASSMSSGGQGYPGGSGGGRGRDEELLRDAYDFALKATEQDSLGQHRTAMFYYVVCRPIMINHVNVIIFIKIMCLSCSKVVMVVVN